ncbi:MAG: hypothetical protein Kow0063_14680 [Anaerolineae bacterium]
MLVCRRAATPYRGWRIPMPWLAHPYAVAGASLCRGWRIPMPWLAHPYAVAGASLCASYRG